jgi:hypothetical protein
MWQSRVLTLQIIVHNENTTNITYNLYKYGLDKKYDKVSFKRPKSEKKLPKVIDGDFIKVQLSKIENLKHKTILSLTFSYLVFLF